MNGKLFLVLDIGTSYLKCGAIDAADNTVVLCRREFPMMQNQGTFEIDFDVFFDTTINLLKDCLGEDAVLRSGVEALLITSQAQTFVPVDADFRPLRPGIVWLDERAKEEAAWLQERLPDFTAAAGFAHPLSAQYVSKLLWLKRHERDVFQKARAFPLINEYLVFKLTSRFYSDSTSFGMGGVYDFRRNDLNPAILRILGLTKDFFPQVERAAARTELISERIQQEWKLNERFPVFLCGNDQGASAAGAGLKQPGDVNINFGTAMVFYTITESLTTELTEDQIAGKHPVGNDFFLLNFESDYGIQIRRLKNKFFKHGTYDQLFQTYNFYPDVAAQAPVSDNLQLNSLSSTESQRLCAGVIQYYLDRLMEHFDQIQKATDIENIFLSGGMMQSKVWLQILQETLKRPLTIANRADAGLFGVIDIYRHSKNRRNKND